MKIILPVHNNKYTKTWWWGISFVSPNFDYFMCHKNYSRKSDVKRAAKKFAKDHNFEIVKEIAK